MDGLPGVPIFFQLMGRPRWRLAGRPAKSLPSAAAALIAMLALEGPQGRDVLAGRFWPDSTTGRAKANLRKLISRLRTQTKHRLFATGATLSLESSVRVDVLDLAQMTVEQLLDDEFLAGCDYGETEFLEAWVHDRRIVLQAPRAEALALHAEALEKRQELMAAIGLAQRVVALAPFHEHALRRLMRLHFLRGDSVAAIDAFERFERRMREHTNARPGPETLRLLDTIERGRDAIALPIEALPVSLVRPPALIGRRVEWLAMGRAWSASRPFLLIGEAGIGKSRLLGDYVQGMAGVVAERARAGDEVQAPYAVMARLLRGVLALRVASPGPFARSELSRILPELGLAAPQPPRGARGAQEALTASLRRAVESVMVDAMAAGLSVVVVDDLHFADLATLEMLRWLTASPLLAALRFGLAARAIDGGPAAALLKSWLDDSQRPERIELKLLQRADVEVLLESLDLPEFDAADLGARLYAHASGHPLFTLETLKDAWLHRQDIGHEVLPSPQTVQTLLERRLQDLPPAALALARVVAVAGVDCSPELAAQLLETSPLALADAWSLLERANVLQGIRFVHDLMYDVALALVPQPLRCTLHAAVASLLSADVTVPRARIANHWEAAERWAEAGRCWHQAADEARRTGRLPEQHALLERAAACYRRAGDGEAEFDAVHAAFEGLQMRYGGNAVLTALPRLEALAQGARAQALCRLAHSEALLDLQHSAMALEQASAALRLAVDHPQLMGDAHCLRGMALAQLGKDDDAIAASVEAVDAAAVAEMPVQELRAVRALGYALYKAGRLGDSLPVHRRLLELAQRIGDASDIAAAEASTAGLLAATGDTPASLEHARRAHRSYCDMGLAHNSTVGTFNLTVLGRSAAYMGGYTEATDALSLALQMSGDQSAVVAQAKARICLANVRLTLGDSTGASEFVRVLPSGTPPGMRMQASLVLAWAERMDGGSGEQHLQRLGRLGDEHADLPLVASAWIEYSYQGDAKTVLGRLRRVRDRFEAMGLAGTARSLQLREIDRMCELEDDESRAAAARYALGLLPFVERGLHASTYPPEGWAILARALGRGGNSATSAMCRTQARAWLHDVALPHVPEADRDRFVQRNPFNRRVLAEVD